MGKVILSGYIVVPDEDLESVKEQLPQHIALTRDEPGCLVFDVQLDGDSNNRYNVYEEFRDMSAFELHQERVKCSSWGEVTKNVSRHYTVSEEGGV